ncbi:MAG: DNA polymerase III subunit delta [Christensenellales bacterium]
MLFKDLKKSLTENIFGCYILSCGKDKEDVYLKSSAINNIKNAVVGDFVDLNFQVFTPENLDATNLKKSLETMPFMSEKKLVLIKETDGIKDKDVLTYLKHYLENPVENSVLVIDECEESYFSELEKIQSVCVVDCARVDRSILESFVLRSCKNKGFSIDIDAIEKLIDFTDGYMSKLELELEKIQSLKLNEKTITSIDIKENVSKSDEYQIFELTQSLFNKDAEKALFIVEDIIKNKKNVSIILSLIFNYIRRSFFAKISKDSPQETAKMLEIKEFAVKKLKEQVQNVSAKKLKEMLVLCKEIDYKVKSGNLDLVTAIYNLVFTILVEI